MGKEIEYTGPSIEDRKELQKKATPKPVLSAGSAKVRPLRTFKADVEEALKKQKASKASMIMAEQDRREKRGEPRVVKKKKKKKKPIKKEETSSSHLPILVTILLLVIAAPIGWYLSQTDGAQSILNKELLPSLIEIDQQRSMDITALSGQDLLNALAVEFTDDELHVDQIKDIYMTTTTETEEGNVTEPITGEILIEKLPTHIPGPLVRSLNDEVDLGFHAFEGVHGYLLLRTTFYDAAFAGMLKWERSLANDLLPLLEGVSGKERVKPGFTHFSDEVVRGLDIRKLINQDGELVILYTFIDENTILITGNSDTFNELLNRLHVSSS